MRKNPATLEMQKRLSSFSEVSLGLTKEQAKEEAGRCLQCKNSPCISGCPVNIQIPDFIKMIKEDRPEEALKKILEKNNLPAVCGRVCPQENQCEKACVLQKKNMPINIGALERYVSDYASQEQGIIENKAKKDKVAVVGSGPAGLTCAADLAKSGYAVVIFESLHQAGGVLRYGIPEFRLPKKILDRELEYIKSLGVNIKLNALIGRTQTIEGLFKEGFRAVFIATGAGLPQTLGIPGENANLVYSANEFLTRVNLMKAYQFPEYATPINIGENVVVVGAGNVAIDCARIAKRLNKNVTLVYRRSENEMPARAEEVTHAKEEQINLKLLTQPVKIITDEKNFIKEIACIKMELGDADASGRKRPVPVKGSEFNIKADTLIVAIGQNPNPLIPALTKDLAINKNGTIVVDENCMTSIKGVFAGGDITTGADTVISAMGAGKKAAEEIDKYIKHNL
ncbi:MAG: NADPH-dependent glutamate synthase [Candidatus Omnitrophica bacterium]|jgi:glutamate synthase (NADPH/NADH) small chain|nr:NADPH-dependent glutamate synthase [Candidatus Omnitrophota bacterium]